MNLKAVRKKTAGDRVFETMNTVLMILVILITLYPFIYILMYSLSDGSQVYGKLLIWPKAFNVDSYISLFVNSDILRSFFVSVARSTIGPVVTITIGFMAAYSMSKQIVFRKFLSRYIVFPMYFTAGIIPVYILMSKLQLTGSFFVYIMPRVANIFLFILMRTYIEGLPDEIEESAFIDGASHYRIAWQIIFPLCLPVIAAVSLFECIAQWNAYQDTLFYNAEVSRLHTLQYVLVRYLNTVQLGLEDMEKGNVVLSTPQTLRMAMTIITVAPIAAVYPFLQKYFVKGLLIGSIKG